MNYKSRAKKDGIVDNSQYLDNLTQIILLQAELVEKSVRVEWKYRSIERLIIDQGKGFGRIVKPSPFTAKLKSCYENCFELMLQHPELYYCEGFATSRNTPLAISHAWLINKAEEVIDPTWWDSSKLENCVYYGVAFNKNFVVKITERTKVYGILDSDYLLEHQFKKFGFPEAALANY